MIAWLLAAFLVAGPTPDTTLTLATPSDGVLRVALRAALVGRDTGVVVEVKNSADSARRVVIRCEALHGASIADSLLIAQPETLIVPARASAATRVRLPAALATLAPGVYWSAIVATAGPATLRRQLMVTVDRLPLTMLIGPSWTVRVIRTVPGTRWFRLGRSAVLPIPADADTDLLSSSLDSIGTALAGPMGAVAYAHRGGAIRPLAPGVLGVPLVFDHLSTAGDYTGPLTLLPGLPDSKVALTVRVTDCWIWPAVAIMAGILLAFLLQRYTSVDRVSMQLKADVLQLATQWTDAEHQFTAALSAESRYEIGGDFGRQWNTLLSDVAALNRPLFVPLDDNNPAYKSARDRLATLRGVVADWPHFAADLNALASALKDVQTQADALKMSPRVETVGLTLLHGGPITVADFASIRSRVTDTTTFLGDWIDCAERLVDDQKHLATLSPSGSNKEKYDQLLGDMNQVRHELQTAKSAADLSRLGTQKTLDGAEALLAQLQVTLVHPKTAKKSRVIEPRAGTAESPEKHRRRILDTITRDDIFFLGLTLLVAGLGGFKTLYLGQNSFGSVADYIAAILWGFGTRYTLDTLVTVVGRFFKS